MKKRCPEFNQAGYEQAPVVSGSGLESPTEDDVVVLGHVPREAEIGIAAAELPYVADLLQAVRWGVR